MNLKSLLSMAVLIASIATATVTTAADITYDLYRQQASLQGGYTLTGKVTTDGTINQNLTAANILSWSFDFNGPSGDFHAANTDQPSGNSAAPQATVGGSLFATATDLELSYPLFGNENDLELSGVGVTPTLFYHYDGPGFTNSGGPAYSGFFTGAGSPWTSAPTTSLPNTWSIATAEAVPEPSGLILGATGGMCVLLYVAGFGSRRWNLVRLKHSAR